MLRNLISEEFRYKPELRIEPIFVTKTRYSEVSIQIQSRGKTKNCYYTQNIGRKGTVFNSREGRDLLLNNDFELYRYKLHRSNEFSVVTKLLNQDATVQSRGKEAMCDKVVLFVCAMIPVALVLFISWFCDMGIGETLVSIFFCFLFCIFRR